ncbi:hypothetical protein WJX81_002597 [Elliptochloris bilobata]|uniref:Protein VACUOLELESS1 n=1 Tax=Elliptochloris bilobata TaxID=381761 RepID=A0AAW1QNS9_9CHLO
MANLSPVGDWDECGDKFYAKHQLFSMQWLDINLEHMRVACAQYGGPIALVRDDRKIVLVTGGATKPVVTTYTAAGVRLGAFVWERGRIMGMGWTSEEDLMLLEQSGEVHLYSMHGQAQARSFSLGGEVAREGVAACCLYGGGLVALTAGLQLWAVTDLEEPRPQRLADPRLAGPPHCLAVMEPRHTLSGCIEVLVAAGDGVLVVDADSASEAAAAVGPIHAMAVAPGGQFVAVFTGDGRLVVLTADFAKNLSEFATQSDAPPDQLAWCGADSVVLVWEDILLMVGPYGDWVKHTVELGAALVPECDGVRMVTATRHDLLRRVPDCLADVFRIGSTAPGALLYDARALFDAQDARADEVLRSIAGALPNAVRTCLAAASAELDLARQAALLKAACYGRAFCAADALPRDAILTVARHLRILNALRAPDVGLPLTLAQLEALTPPVLVARLVAGRRHLLALRIAGALGLSAEGVLVHWACAKISASGDAPDERLRDALVARLAPCAGVRYAAIAAHAQAAGQRSLAALLLEHEPCAAEQVPLLLGLGDEERALGKALESGDPDLAHLAIFRMYRALPLERFLAALASRPAARALFTAYAARTEPELLEQVHMATGMYEGVAELRLAEALAAQTRLADARAGGAQSAPEAAVAALVRLLDRAADMFAQTREHNFQARSAGEWAQLRRLQADLEAETAHACFLGLSLAATLRQCIRLGNARAAARVRTEFRVSDKRFWPLKVRTLAREKDWDGLEAFAREKKPPIGFEPFVAAARAHGAPDAVTARFIARMADGKRKAEEYAAIKMFQEAADNILTTPAKMDDGPFAFKDDGTAKDPKAFQQALRADAERMTALDSEPEVKHIVLGDDMHAFQELIKGIYHDEKKRQERASKAMSERTIDAQRASATVPRDTVQLYKQLYDAGLQYGPAFRLLRNVHVPDVS